MDLIQQKFGKMYWRYATGDLSALEELEARMAAAGRKRSLITYSELVKGVPFDLPNLSQSPRLIDVTDWQDLDRTIVGDYLGCSSMRSYERARFFISALVVSKLDGSPGDGFYTLLRELGLVSTAQSDKALDIWAEHVAKAHTWFSQHQGTL